MRRLWIALIFLSLAACQSTGTSGSLQSSESCWWVHTCFDTLRNTQGTQAQVTLDYKGSYEPYTLRVTVTQYGMDGQFEPVRRIIAQEPAQVEILNLKANSSSYNWQWRFQQHPGTEPAAHDADALYRLPYPDGQSYEVLQGYGGTYSHGGDNFFSIDFDMPIGTSVLAARGGIVVGARSESNRKGRGQDNHVIIRHSDGTYGWYLHLRQNGVTVELGQAVEAGDLIGYSGDTGYSSRPHLHFQVSSVVDSPDDLYTSFPTRFVTDDGVVAKLQKDRWYTAAPLPAVPAS